MSTITLRSTKGSPLTNTEVDNNFTNLNTDKLEFGGTYSGGTANGVAYLNGSKVLTTGSALTFDGTTLTNTGALSIQGNTTLGNASTDTVTVNGYMGVGGAPSASNAVWVRSNALTGTGQAGTRSEITGTSAATSYVAGAIVSASTAADSFTTTNAYQLFVNNSTKGAGSTITNQHGVYIADQTQGTNNYGITSAVSSGTNKWNIYASGTAANYFAGNVAVGTTSTSYKFDLALSSSGNLLRTVYTGTVGGSNKNAAIGFSASSNSLVNIQAGNDDNTVAVGVLLSGVERFKVSQTEAVFNDPGNDYDFRVESDTNTHALFVDAGNDRVAVGTSSPSTAFQIGNNVGAVSPRIAFLSERYSGTGGAQLIGQWPSGGLWGIGHGTGSADNLVRIGAVSSTSTATWNTSSVGLQVGSILFNGDTAAANALDDYEEGTWTPEAVGRTSAGTGTYTRQSGWYTKVGRQVFAVFDIGWSSHTGTGGMEITLPFAVAASGYQGGAYVTFNGGATVAVDYYQLYGWMDSGGSRVRMWATNYSGTSSSKGMQSSLAELHMVVIYNV